MAASGLRRSYGYAVTAGVLRGRPFGGVSIAWSRDLGHVINPVTNYRLKIAVLMIFLSKLVKRATDRQNKPQTSNEAF